MISDSQPETNLSILYKATSPIRKHQDQEHILISISTPKMEEWRSPNILMHLTRPSIQGQKDSILLNRVQGLQATFKEIQLMVRPSIFCLRGRVMDVVCFLEELEMDIGSLNLLLDLELINKLHNLDITVTISITKLSTNDNTFSITINT